MEPEPRRSVSQPGHRYWQMIVLAFGVACAVAAGLYHLAYFYVLNEAERDIQAMLLSHKGLHRYAQEIMHPVFFKLKAEGMIAEKFYSPRSSPRRSSSEISIRNTMRSVRPRAWKRSTTRWPLSIRAIR